MKPINIVLGILVSTFLFFNTSCRLKVESNDASIKEPTEWSRTWIPATDKHDLPRVLLIGDSHVERYYPVVQKKMAGIAYCGKLTTSKSLGDPVLLEEIKLILKQYDFSLITFNNGLHGKGYTEKQYGKYIPLVFDLFRKYSKAQVIWVNTTPVRKKENLAEFDAFTDRVKERNRLVREYTGKHGIPMVDLFSFGEHVDYYTDDGVHFNPPGVAAEAETLANKIKELLN